MLASRRAPPLPRTLLLPCWGTAAVQDVSPGPQGSVGHRARGCLGHVGVWGLWGAVLVQGPWGHCVVTARLVLAQEGSSSPLPWGTRNGGAGRCLFAPQGLFHTPRHCHLFLWLQSSPALRLSCPGEGNPHSCCFGRAICPEGDLLEKSSCCRHREKPEPSLLPDPVRPGLAAAQGCAGARRQLRGGQGVPTAVPSGGPGMGSSSWGAGDGP